MLVGACCGCVAPRSAARVPQPPQRRPSAPGEPRSRARVPASCGSSRRRAKRAHLRTMSRVVGVGVSIGGGDAPCSPARAASIVVLAAAAAVAAPAARRTDQHGPRTSSSLTIFLSNLFGIRNFASRVYLLFFALRSPRPGLVFPSSHPRKSRVPFRPGNAGLFGAYYGMLEDQACIHRRGTSVAPDKLAFGPRSRAGHVWVARRKILLIRILPWMRYRACPASLRNTVRGPKGPARIAS